MEEHQDSVNDCAGDSGAECKWTGFAVIKVAEAKNTFNMCLCVARSCCTGHKAEDVWNGRTPVNDCGGDKCKWDGFAVIKVIFIEIQYWSLVVRIHNTDTTYPHMTYTVRAEL